MQSHGVYRSPSTEEYINLQINIGLLKLNGQIQPQEIFYCSSIIEAETDNSNPVPPESRFVVKKGSVILDISS